MKKKHPIESERYQILKTVLHTSGILQERNGLESCFLFQVCKKEMLNFLITFYFILSQDCHSVKTGSFEVWVAFGEYLKEHSVSLLQSYLRGGCCPVARKGWSFRKCSLVLSSPWIILSLKPLSFLTRADCLHYHPSSAKSEKNSSHSGKYIAMQGYSLSSLCSHS